MTNNVIKVVWSVKSVRGNKYILIILAMRVVEKSIGEHMSINAGSVALANVLVFGCVNEK